MQVSVATVSYQEEAINAKKLYKSKDGSITCKIFS